MQNNFLSHKKIMLGLLGNICEQAFSFLWNSHEVKKSEIIKSQGDESSKTIFVKQDKAHNKIISKHVLYHFKTLAYYQLQHEKEMMVVLKNFLQKNILTPQVIRFVHKKNYVQLDTQYISGKTLDKFTSEFQRQTLDTILSSFESTTEKLDKTTLNLLPKKSPRFIFLTSFLYFFIAFFKEPKNAKLYLSLFLKFIFTYYRYVFSPVKYVLTHKDLASENILISGKKIVILDPEVVSLAQKGTELALLSRYYFQTMEKKELIKLVISHVKSEDQKKEFLALTLFYTLQMLSIEKKNTRFYIQAIEYIPFLTHEILPELNMNERTMGEILYEFLMNVTTFINNIFGRKTEPYILCYHSVSNDGWRFSTPVKSFEDQIEYLVKNHTILPLEKVIHSKNKKAVAITFDDGYEDFMITALPILKKYKVPVTLFALGLPENVNRNELMNNKKILTYDNIKKINRSKISIGFHTATHANLQVLSHRQLIEEIYDAKNNFECKTNIKLSYFAYPRGLYSQYISEVVRHAGFEAAFTVDHSGIKNANKYFIPRVSLEGNISLEQFIASTSRLGLFLGSMYMNLLKVKDRMFLPQNNKTQDVDLEKNIIAV